MIFTIIQYRNSESVAGAWPKQALLTPTFVMLAMSVISLVADAVTLGMQCFGGVVASTATTYAGYVKRAMTVVQLIVNAAGAGYFKDAKDTSGGNDLWGWSCSGLLPRVHIFSVKGFRC